MKINSNFWWRQFPVYAHTWWWSSGSLLLMTPPAKKKLLKTNTMWNFGNVLASINKNLKSVCHNRKSVRFLNIWRKLIRVTSLFHKPLLLNKLGPTISKRVKVVCAKVTRDKNNFELIILNGAYSVMCKTSNVRVSSQTYWYRRYRGAWYPNSMNRSCRQSLPRADKTGPCMLSCTTLFKNRLRPD